VEGRGLPPPLPNSEGRRPESLGGRQVAVSYADTAPQFTSRLVPLTAEEKHGAFIYPEWDVTLGAYRPEWVALRPRRLRAGTTDWVEGVIRRRHAHVQAIKRQFETLRPERQRQRRQDDGEDLDLDVIVASHVDRKLGFPPDERPYARTREDRRDIAVAFLIDLSGSTGGYIAGPRGGERVIDVAKESLVLLGEALTTLDDRHAIYGFSGSTRKGCEFYTVKEFADAWDDEAKRRLGGLAPLSYTRLGPPIRHTATLLGAILARVKLLMLLSDGRPQRLRRLWRRVRDRRHAQGAAGSARSRHPHLLPDDRRRGARLHAPPLRPRQLRHPGRCHRPAAQAARPLSAADGGVSKSEEIRYCPIPVVSRMALVER
jgi:nitric oxide reductase activation protein